MNDFSIKEMQEMQKQPQDKYKDKWEEIGPEAGKQNYYGYSKREAYI